MADQLSTNESLSEDVSKVSPRMVELESEKERHPQGSAAARTEDDLSSGDEGFDRSEASRSNVDRSERSVAFASDDDSEGSEKETKNNHMTPRTQEAENSRTPRVTAMIDTEGGIGMHLAALNSLADDELDKKASKVREIRNICHADANSKPIVRREGGLKTLIDLIADEENPPILIRESIMALRDCTFQDKEGLDILLELDAPLHIMMNMGKNTNNSEIQQASLFALGWIVTGMTPKTEEELLTEMETRKKEGGSRQRGLSSLMSFLTSPSKDKKGEDEQDTLRDDTVQTEDETMVALLLSALRRHVSHPGVVREACTTIRAIFKQYPKAETWFEQYGGEDCLRSAGQQFPDIAAVRVAVEDILGEELPPPEDLIVPKGQLVMGKNGSLQVVKTGEVKRTCDVCIVS